MHRGKNRISSREHSYVPNTAKRAGNGLWLCKQERHWWTSRSFASVGSVDSNEQVIQDSEDTEDVGHAFKWVKVLKCSCVRGRAGLTERDCTFLRICFQTDRGLCVTTKWWWEGRDEGLETWKEPAEAAASYLLNIRQSWDWGQWGVEVVADVQGGKLSVSLLTVS